MFLYDVYILIDVLCFIDWLKYRYFMLYWCFKADVAATNAISVVYAACKPPGSDVSEWGYKFDNQ